MRFGLVGLGYLFIGMLLGWSGAVLSEKANLDSGLATLVGSALGAGVTVAGAMWVAAYQNSAQAQAAQQYAGAAVAGVRDEAHCMARMARTEGVESFELHAAKMVQTIDLLKENVKLWQSGMPYKEVQNFQARLMFTKVERTLIATSSQLDRDRTFLVGRVTQDVINTAVNNLGHIGDEVQDILQRGHGDPRV